MAEIGHFEEAFTKTVSTILIFVIGFGTYFSMMTFHGEIETRVVNRMEMNLAEQLLRDKFLMSRSSYGIRPGIVNASKLSRACETGQCNKNFLEVKLGTYSWGIKLITESHGAVFGDYVDGEGKAYSIFIYNKTENKFYPGRMYVWVGKRV
ncbi:MAG: hypothetical protein ABEK17_02655 [Candidatus Aenigmatarchaeota archaeon]